MSKTTKNFMIIAAIVIVAALAYTVMTTREHRTLGEKMDAAVEKLDDGGIDDAARELKDRTPAEKVEDAVKDATDTENK